jgi:predicted enzyme related to lactoylglutathione lyase
MLGKQNIMAFVATTDASKARPFYEQMLGLKVTGSDPYAVSFDANGITLRLSIVRELKPAPYSILSWVVSDIHSVISGLTANKVVFEQDEAGVWTAPDGTQVAWFKDPDGNLLSLTQFNR